MCKPPKFFFGKRPFFGKWRVARQGVDSTVVSCPGNQQLLKTGAVGRRKEIYEEGPKNKN